MTKFTSKKLSKKLKEAGCELESEMWWCGNEKLDYEIGRATKYNLLKSYRAYDILNDICCKYAKEFFGEETDEFVPIKYYCLNIFFMVQDGKIQEAEEYIWEHCKFNHRNNN